MPNLTPQSSHRPLFSLILMAAILAGATGCEKPKELNTESIALKAQLEQLKIQEGEVEDELLKLTRSNASASTNSIVRKSGSTIDQKKDSMANEVSALNARKAQLEQEIEFLAKQNSSYRQKYL